MPHKRPYCRLAPPILFAVALFGFATPSFAYLCSRNLDIYDNRTGPSFAWLNRDIAYAFNQNSTQKLDAHDAMEAVRKSFAVWQNVTLRPGEGPTCPLIKAVPYTTDLTFTELPPTSQNFSGFNYLDPNANLNLILFRDTTWPHFDPNTSGVIALTTTTFNNITGEIFDADVEFNTGKFQFSTTDDTSQVQTDLMNTATHELGHFLGFSHSYIATATMYGYAKKGETTKRMLSCNDVTLLLFRYPTGAPTGYCDETNQLTCGDCQPPNAMHTSPSINVSYANAGLRPVNCQHVPGAAWFLTALLAVRRGMRLRAVRRSAHRKG